MAILNKATWKQKFSDFINRVAPFNVFALIQKPEHQEVIGDDLGDSVLFKAPIIQVINNPVSTDIDTDFQTGDRFDIDTSGSAGNIFTITLSNLEGNETAFINITKKEADTFSFANSQVYTGADTFPQEGLTEIIFKVINVDGVFISELKTPALDRIMITRKSLSQEILSPLENFDIDFELGTRANVSTAGSIGLDFVATLSNLQDNETGIVSVVKEVADVITFSNAVITPDDTRDKQIGETALIFLVRAVNGVFIAELISPSSKVNLNVGNSAPSFTERKTETFEIGVWNMQNDNVITFLHTLGANFINIRRVDVTIINDDGDELRPLLGRFDGSNEVRGDIRVITSTDITLVRSGGSVFSNSSHNDSVINRGWITIEYED